MRTYGLLALVLPLARVWEAGVPGILVGVSHSPVVHLDLAFRLGLVESLRIAGATPVVDRGVRATVMHVVGALRATERAFLDRKSVV